MTIGLKRIFVIVVSVLFQLFIVGLLLWLFPDLSRIIITVLQVLAVVIALFIIRSDMSPDYKLTWIFVIFMAPVIGVLVYLIATKKNSNYYDSDIIANNETVAALKDDSFLLEYYDDGIKKQLHYLKNYAKSCVFNGNDTTYYPLGELMWQDMLTELKKAERFIFMEYFIIEKGKMLDAIIDILKEKASQGVEVRFMFDSLGSLTKAPENFKADLEAHGVKCYPFNSKVSIFDFGFNNRDHRKITVIDGKVAFTGGVNLADEYINQIEVFGHWKDTGIKIVGSAVNYFTIMFLTVWSFADDTISNYQKYLVDDYQKFDNSSFIAPYTFYPHNHERVGEVMYNSMLKKAKDYVYITTPYLILDYTMLNEFIATAKEGVDIRLIMPGIPDKQTVYMLSRSFYKPLLEAGVRIFEYTPGFVHCKQFVSDDKTAIIGTINLDYRSLTHHLENAVWLLHDKSVMAIKEDFLKTQAACREVTLEDMSSSKIKELIVLPILRAFAPLF